MQTFPLASRRKRRLAFPAKLVSQRDLLALAVAKQNRAELARISVIDAENLFLLRHGHGEQLVG
jgi:hypothetical protein